MLVAAVEELDLAHIRLWDRREYHAVFQQQRTLKKVDCMPHPGGDKMQQFLVPCEWKRDSGVVVDDAVPGHLYCGEVFADPVQPESATPVGELLNVAEIEGGGARDR